jgi:hypothetical protein
MSGRQFDARPNRDKPSGPGSTHGNAHMERLSVV